MQTANIILSLGGDSGNQVPKYGVTAAEIAVLQAIHGNDAVADIEPLGDVQRSHRDERARLLAIYGRMRDQRDVSPVSILFPGVAARVFETLAELDLDESFFKATGRVAAKAEPVAERPAAAPTAIEVVSKSAAEKRAEAAAARRAAKQAAAQAAQQAAAEAAAAAAAAEAAAEQPDEDADDEADGIGEINDGHEQPASQQPPPNAFE